MAIERDAPIWMHEIDVADVDAELERRGGDERLELARLEPLLGVEPARGREAAVMARDVVLAEPRAEARRDALGHLARVDEDERGPMLAHELGDALVDLLPHLVRADRRERRRRHLDREIEVAKVPGVDERALASAPTRNRATSSSGFCVAERPMRCRGFGPPVERLEPLERKREVRAALVARERVDLVDDDGASPS